MGLWNGANLMLLKPIYKNNREKWPYISRNLYCSYNEDMVSVVIFSIYECVYLNDKQQSINMTAFVLYTWSCFSSHLQSLISSTAILFQRFIAVKWVGKYFFFVIILWLIVLCWVCGVQFFHFFCPSVSGYVCANAKI